MSVPPVLRILRERPELAELAAFPFDFDLDRAEHLEDVRLASGAPIEPVAGDDTGGTYFLCAGGEVLYAGSEGQAGLIGDSLAEALETLIGLPSWYDYVSVDTSAGDEALAAEIAGIEADLCETYGTGLEAARTTLLDGLGLRRVPGPELIRRLQRALLRTEPDFLLLNADEGLAYNPMDRLPRPPLWEIALAPGRADLAEARADAGRWAEIAADEGRRAGVLRAAQYDRRPEDLPLLRVLLRHEAPQLVTEEFRLAAVLVGLHGGSAEDHAFLHELYDTDFDVHCHLGGFPDTPDGMRRWAAELDASNYGEDPADEHPFTWIDLAIRQGRTETARAALLRLLDHHDLRLYSVRQGDPPELLEGVTGPLLGHPRTDLQDAPTLRSLAFRLEQIGDHRQAARAQRLYASLLEEPFERVGALRTLAALHRKAGEIDAAWRSLQRTADSLDGTYWREVQLGHFLIEEHFLTARAALDAGLPSTAHEALDAGKALLSRLPRPAEELHRMADGLTAALDPDH
ncbi:hypothetical protein [Thermomonospora amylolytica]|uniref:hypothetical protein n=1 Tax=Thermomonospora amylolytica TaxID=1411117 RepID=UPI001300A6B8|nr:hypothetical protein [Thermomonospora amylolytica]